MVPLKGEAERETFLSGPAGTVGDITTIATVTATPIPFTPFQSAPLRKKS